MSITGLGHGIPPDEDSDGSATDIHTDDHVSEEDPLGDEVVVALSRLLSHDVRIGWIERQGGSRGTICNQVYPEKLDGVESLRDTKHGSEEDGCNFSDVT